VAGSFEHSNETPVSVRDGEFPEKQNVGSLLDSQEGL
jgi:hypothetical protein